MGANLDDEVHELADEVIVAAGGFRLGLDQEQAEHPRQFAKHLHHRPQARLIGRGGLLLDPLGVDELVHLTHEIEERRHRDRCVEIVVHAPKELLPQRRHVGPGGRHRRVAGGPVARQERVEGGAGETLEALEEALEGLHGAGALAERLLTEGDRTAVVGGEEEEADRLGAVAGEEVLEGLGAG